MRFISVLFLPIAGWLFILLLLDCHNKSRMGPCSLTFINNKQDHFTATVDLYSIHTSVAKELIRLIDAFASYTFSQSSILRVSSSESNLLSSFHIQAEPNSISYSYKLDSFAVRPPSLFDVHKLNWSGTYTLCSKKKWDIYTRMGLG